MSEAETGVEHVTDEPAVAPLTADELEELRRKYRRIEATDSIRPEFAREMVGDMKRVLRELFRRGAA